MTKYTRITGKVFGSSADPTGSVDPTIGATIGQFGSALAGTYNGTSDVATIQGLSAWQDGFIGAVTPNTQFPPLPEMTGFGKVLSYQLCYLLQQGVAEYDSGTTYYDGNWVSYNKALYVAKQDNFSNQLPTNTTYWTKFTGGSGRNLGEYVTSSLPIVDDDTLHLADGSLLSQQNYPDFVSHISNLYNSLPSGEFQQATQKLTGSSWRKIAYGNGLYVAVKNGVSAVSSDGSTWTEYTVADLADVTDVTFDGTNFVALSNFYVLTSPDGETWTAAAHGLENFEKYIAYGNSLYVAISNAGDVSYTSNLSGTWQDGGSISSYFNVVNGLNFGDGKFIAMGLWGEIAYSTNATSWTEQTIAQNLVGWEDIIYNEEKFIAINEYGYIVESIGNDITNWDTPVQISNLGNNNWVGLAYNNLKTVALSSTGYISIEEMPYTNVFTSEADWQTSYTTYGECGKYVYNSGANTVRIPAVNSYFTNTYDTQKVGNLTEASLPNIKGAFNHETTSGTATGAFSIGSSIAGENAAPGGDTDHLIEFDAGSYNSIYKDSATTVNTQSIKQLVYIVVKQ